MQTGSLQVFHMSVFRCILQILGTSKGKNGDIKTKSCYNRSLSEYCNASMD